MHQFYKSVRPLYRKMLYLPAIVVALPFIAIALVTDKIYGHIVEPSLLISRIPFMFGETARWFYYKALLLSVGSDVRFKYGSFCQYRKARIGNRVIISYFAAIGEVSIGDNVLVGGGVNLLSGLHQHSFDDPGKLIWDSPGERRMITIGSDVWIGSNSLIGCDIGDRCVVALGSVVVKEVEPHSIVAGNPAKVIRKL